VPYPEEETAVTADGATVVYTDGACRGNPGPGGWAWAVPGGSWASGADPATTNQRMEVTAVAEALAALDGPVLVRSDSTYVVHCWRDRWWEGWQRRGWRNSKKEPVANRDLWEPLVEQFATREDLRLEWVKGHGGDPFNDLVDRLAVRASFAQTGDRGEVPPREDQLGPPDDVAGGGVAAAGPIMSAAPRRSDGRVPAGRPVAVVGVRDQALEGSTAGRELRRRLAAVLQAHAELHPDVVVLTGLRAGAESVAADAATEAGVPYVAVLPYPDPTAGWSAGRRRSFDDRLAGAREVVTLERRRPADLAGRRSALARRDGWLRSAAAAAVVVTDGEDPEAELLLRRFEADLGDEVWRLDL
jgi:ribonuclease HI